MIAKRKVSWKTLAVAPTSVIHPKTAVPAPSRKARVWLLALVALTLTLLYYAPGLLQSSRRADLTSSSLAGGWTGPGDTADFYRQWAALGLPIRTLHLPLWANGPDGSALSGQPLLTTSDAPVFYPLAALYYFGPSGWQVLAFGIAHLWLLLWAGLLVVSWLWRIVRAGRLALTSGAGIGLAAGAMWAGSGQPDVLAALSWGMVGLVILLTGRRSWQLLWLTLVLGMVLLAQGGAFGLGVCLSLLTLAMLLEILQQVGVGQLLRLGGCLLVVLVGAVSLAGPQLGPRLAYNLHFEQVGADWNIGVEGTVPKLVTTPLLIANDELAARQAYRSGANNAGQKLVLTGVISEQVRAKLVTDPNAVKVEPALQPTAARLTFLPTSSPFLVLLPVRFADGWHAKILADGERKDQVLALYQADLSYCAVLVDPSQLKFEGTGLQSAIVQLDYRPLSFELGLYGAFLALISVAIGMGVLGWARFYRPEDDTRTVRRVAKNSVTPLLAQLTGKIIDVGFAIFTLRLLGPDGNGAYGIAVTTWVFLATLSEFGLETLTTRDVARDRSPANANHYLSTIFVTRSLLSLTALPVSVLVIGGLGLSGNLTAASGWAIVVLAVGLIPSGLSGSLSAIFRAYEKFEYTAALQIFTAIFKVPLGLTLLLVWGVVGLAASALVVNLVTLALLYAIFRRKLFVPHLTKFDWRLARRMLREAYPLMLNGFLINVFFQSDVYLLLPFKGETQVGWYNAAYKFINGLLIIPSTLTLALFPLFSSYGQDAKANLTRAYREALRILVAIALPVSVGTLFVAYDIIGTVSGSDYLPHTAIALQILIWFLPFSYINGVTQYVLIALNRQRTITIAVIGSVITNVGLNLVFIPFFGYVAASAMTIVSEIALLVPFSLIIKRELGTLPVLEASWRPILAAGMMGAVLAVLTLGLHIQNFGLTVAVAIIIYPVALLLVRGFTKADLTMLKAALRR